MVAHDTTLAGKAPQQRRADVRRERRGRTFRSHHRHQLDQQRCRNDPTQGRARIQAFPLPAHGGRAKAETEEAPGSQGPSDPLIRRAAKLGIQSIELAPESNTLKIFPSNLEHAFKEELPGQTEKEIIVILRLVAWWLEYERARDNKCDNWTCPDCHKATHRSKDHCPDPECDSWNKLHAITGNPIMQPLPDHKRRRQRGGK